MKLPEADQVRIDDLKIGGYLLSPEHSVGRFKARVFASAGFVESTAELFVSELRRIRARWKRSKTSSRSEVHCPW